MIARIKLLGIAIIITLIIISCKEPDYPHIHVWGGWEVTTAPTCITEGIETRVCTNDSSHTETRTIPIDPTAHDWLVTDEIIKAPTCTETGEGKTVCTLCGVIDPDHILPALGHDYGNWIETTAPTCTEAGEETGTCSHDATHTTTRIGAPPLEHDYQNWTQTTAPTCTEAGEETGTCSHDATHTTTRIGAAPLGHDYQNWTQTTAPTCTEPGIETGTCSHDATHTTTRAIVALGHDYQNWTQTTAPTCTEPGIETGTCTHDATHTTTRIGAAIDPNAHDYQWVTIAPSFIVEGMDKEICSRCDHESGNKRNIVPALPITTTSEWSNAIAQLNGKSGSYTLTIGGNFDVAGYYSNDTFGTTATDGLTVTLKGSGKLHLASQGSIIRLGNNQTLIIDSNDLILEGLINGVNGATQNNNSPIVRVFSAKLELRNGTILGNSSGGVSVEMSGTFTMTGGEISGNKSTGVSVSGYGVFAMSNGIITDNISSSSGGGVAVSRYGTFLMSGGEISGNTATNTGGGTPPSYGGAGGGVYLYSTYRSGGTVYAGSASFSKTGGTITNNMVKNSSGIAVNNRGHNVYTYTLSGLGSDATEIINQY